MNIYPEIDEKGRRFRRIGNCIEYEPIISTSFGNIPESQLEEAQKRHKEQQQKRLQELQRQAQKKSVKQCPFKVTSYNVTCEVSCAWWNGSACLLTCSEGFKTENNRHCPISNRTCQNNCALMHDDKCILLSRMRGEKE